MNSSGGKASMRNWREALELRWKMIRKCWRCEGIVRVGSRLGTCLDFGLPPDIDWGVIVILGVIAHPDGSGARAAGKCKPFKVRRMASRAPMVRRLAVSMT